MILTLVGSPNTGKSTLFNQLTGLKSKVVNYPGSTVDLYCARVGEVEVWDTPGIYGLMAGSEDERLALNQIEKSDVIALVLDATQLPRQLELLKQVRSLNKPFFIVLTMIDLLQKLSIPFDLKQFESLVGVKAIYNSQFELGSLLNVSAESLKPTPTCDYLALEKFIFNYQKPLVQGFRTWSLRWDHFALHSVFGILIFTALMFTLFTSIFWFADPLIGLVETSFELVTGALAQTPAFFGQEFLSEAILPGLASFIVFVPQIFILFFLLNLLEGSGYLARAAFIADSMLLKFGVSGRAFVPLLSGFACAIPALMASRNLRSAKERALTRWVVPLLTCSARIPVFTMLIGTVFKSYGPGVKALGLMGLYFFSLIPAAVTSLVLSRFFLKSETGQSSMLILDMPWYRRPSLRLAFLTASQKSYLFLRRAGPVIFTLSLVIYLLSSYPKPNLADGEILITESYLGQLSAALDPAFKPMGLDGETGVAILAAFAAREVFVSTLAMVRTLEESDDPALADIFGPPAALGLMFFFMVALQCLSTVALQAKESGSWKMALTQLAVFNLVAYAGAIVIYQTATFLGL